MLRVTKCRASVSASVHAIVRPSEYLRGSPVWHQHFDISEGLREGESECERESKSDCERFPRARTDGVDAGLPGAVSEQRVQAQVAVQGGCGRCGCRLSGSRCTCEQVTNVHMSVCMRAYQQNRPEVAGAGRRDVLGELLAVPSRRVAIVLFYCPLSVNRQTLTQKRTRNHPHTQTLRAHTCY